MIELPAKWAAVLTASPETGMGYQICDVELSNGTVAHRIVISGGVITRCDGSSSIPFDVSEIKRIVVTHEK